MILKIVLMLFKHFHFFHTISNEVNNEKDLFAGLYVREGGLNYTTNPQ